MVTPTAAGRASRALPVVGALLVLSAVIGLASLLVGVEEVSVGDLLDVAAGRADRLTEIAVRDLRLPRLILALGGGAALGVAGCLLQDALRNPLAGPELLGVSAGAAAVVAGIVVFEIPLPLAAYPWVALMGGLGAGAVVLVVAARSVGDRGATRLLLVGAAASALLGGVVTAIVSLGAPLEAHLVYRFLLGSLAGRSWDDVGVAAPWLVAGLVVAVGFARPLNLLQLGDDAAEAKGLAVVRTRVLIMVVSAALVAAVTAIAGAIGFVALPAPHIARRLLGRGDARLVLPVSALVGAVLLAASDLAARQVLSPQELPVGLWTTCVGGPVLLILLRRRLAGAGP